MNEHYITYPNVERKRYTIFTDGRVYDTKLNKFLIPFIADGYYAVSLMSIRNGNHKCRMFMLHRLVAHEFIDNPDKLPMVNHKDGNKLNPSVDNLEWCTALHNNLHAIKTGLRPLGEDLSTSKITNAQAHKICQMMEGGYKNIEISKELSIPYTTVQNIRNRSSWNHISKNYTFTTKKRIEEKEVRKICEYLELGFKPKEISKILNIPKSTILNIRDRSTWTDISAEYEFNQSHQLTEDIVNNICVDIEAGLSNIEISNKYAVSYSVVYRIRHRKTWIEVSKLYSLNFKD